MKDREELLFLADIGRRGGGREGAEGGSNLGRGFLFVLQDGTTETYVFELI